jgi:hypothetical protein
MGRIAKQKRLLIEGANKRILGESYKGVIKKEDKSCAIWCKEKIAKVGSSGDVIKLIQHHLSKGLSKYGPYNPNRGGGGMSESCSSNYKDCDGIFRSETKKAVEEFQRDANISPDGVVGYNTLTKICELLARDNYEPSNTLCSKQCQCEGEQKRDTDYVPDDTKVLNKSFIELIYKYDCESLKACMKKLFSKKDMITSKEMSLCISNDVKDGGDKKGRVKPGCEKCPDTVNLMPSMNEKPSDKKFKKYCRDYCGSKATY